MAKAIVQDSSALLARWFSELKGVSPDAIARVRAKVENKLAAGACRNMMPLAPAEFLFSYELRACVEQALREEWDSLTGEERLLISRHPSARLTGARVQLPNQTVGTVISQELTKRMGVLVTVRLPDGTPFGWEFYD
jgi:hypothetical protein